MNRNNVALLLAFGLSAGLAAFSATTFAADPPEKKPAPMQPPGPDGHGMMGPGHGMMGGCDDGMMGMMGGHGMMLESPRIHMVRALDLTDEQRSKINKLSDELQHKNWERMGAIRDESAKLRDLYEADKRDPRQIGAEYQKIFDLKRQMIEAMVDTQNRIEALLTPDQMRQLKAMHHRMPMHGYPEH